MPSPNAGMHAPNSVMTTAHYIELGVLYAKEGRYHDAYKPLRQALTSYGEQNVKDVPFILVSYYGNIHALKGISLEVNEGEIVTLIGANGAGKTTLLMPLDRLLGEGMGGGGDQDASSLDR